MLSRLAAPGLRRNPRPALKGTREGACIRIPKMSGNMRQRHPSVLKQLTCGRKPHFIGKAAKVSTFDAEATIQRAATQVKKPGDVLGGNV